MKLNECDSILIHHLYDTAMYQLRQDASLDLHFGPLSVAIGQGSVLVANELLPGNPIPQICPLLAPHFTSAKGQEQHSTSNLPETTLLKYSICNEIWSSDVYLPDGWCDSNSL